jgi:hypothetical protein
MEFDCRFGGGVGSKRFGAKFGAKLGGGVLMDSEQNLEEVSMDLERNLWEVF